MNNETKEVATSDYNKADLFKRYFVSIVTDPDYSFLIPTKQLEFGNITFYIDQLEISKDLHRVNISKSRGADGLPPAFLRETRIVITRSLKLLFSNIKRLAKFPTKWKGIVSPIHKEIERVNVKNYCSVTLLSIVSKKIEKSCSGQLHLRS